MPRKKAETPGNVPGQKRTRKKPESKKKAVMGRPRVEIDKTAFENLCGLLCTEEEIAAFFNCTVDTINNWCKRNYQDENGRPMTFSDVYKRYSVTGKVSLRRQMAKAAENGNVTMMIFLAKTQLGMHEEFSIDVTNDGAALGIYLPDNGRDRLTDDGQ